MAINTDTQTIFQVINDKRGANRDGQDMNFLHQAAGNHRRRISHLFMRRANPAQHELHVLEQLRPCHPTISYHLLRSQTKPIDREPFLNPYVGPL